MFSNQKWPQFWPFSDLSVPSLPSVAVNKSRSSSTEHAECRSVIMWGISFLHGRTPRLDFPAEVIGNDFHLNEPDVWWCLMVHDSQSVKLHSSFRTRTNEWLLFLGLLHVFYYGPVELLSLCRSLTYFISHNLFCFHSFVSRLRAPAAEQHRHAKMFLTASIWTRVTIIKKCWRWWWKAFS